MRWLCGVAILLWPLVGQAATQLLVTVVDARTGEAVTNLTAAEFTVTDGGRPRAIEGVKQQSGLVDVMLLVDASLVGHVVQPVAGSLIAEMGEKEQMALVAYHSAPDLVQDFTSKKESLAAAVAGIKFGNDPRVLDSVYAAADSGFQSATYRRVILLLTAGVEGNSRVSEKAAIKMCRKNGVSVFPVYASGGERWMMRTLAEETGGASYSLRDLSKATDKPAKRIFEAMRAHYVLTLRGNLALGEKVKVTVGGTRRLQVSALPLE